MSVIVKEAQSGKVGINIRKESVEFFDLNKKNIFSYNSEGYVEISKDFLKQMIQFFENPDNKQFLENK